MRDISEGVGLAKSNVLRYFDSREAIFLELLDEECRAWLAELEDGFGQPRARKPAYANEIRIADIIAETLAERRLMCELLGAMAGVLERNISVAFARDFKVRAMGNIAALSGLVGGQLPWLPAEFVGFIGEGDPDAGGRHVSVLGADRTGAAGHGGAGLSRPAMPIPRRPARRPDDLADRGCCAKPVMTHFQP